ncbi:VanZ family protein [Evansella sp. AB-rgal1]|uniref:VanZ family protein n=1 Tax=Evansella sp. AB-rgal1 TaxID=3242696 RepID=UPI00359EC7C9
MRFLLIFSIIFTVSCFIIVLSIAKETGGMFDSQSIRSIYKANSNPFFFLDTNSTFYYTYALTESAYIQVRKFGHFIAYGILAVMIFIVLFDKNVLLRGTTAVIAASIIGAIDEYHQHFLLARSGRLLDIFINTAGSILFITAMILFHYLFKIKAKLRSIYIERSRSRSM